MSTNIPSKLNQLLLSQPSGVVLLASWLEKLGYSRELQKRYKESGWFEPIGTGAVKRTGDTISYIGAVYALQHQAGLHVHIGGLTALSLLGKAHYIAPSLSRLMIFSAPNVVLPKWFQKYDWGVRLEFYPRSFLPEGAGLSKYSNERFEVKISSAPRAMLECLLLSKSASDFVECYHLMEGLNNLKPSAVQELLEKCTSVKVKRLFLFMADKAGHEWLSHLDLEKIDLGSGKRSLVKDGAYSSKYQITIPKELASHGRAVI